MRDSHRRRAIGPWMLAGGLVVAGALLRVLAGPGGEAAESIPVPPEQAAAFLRETEVDLATKKR